MIRPLLVIASLALLAAAAVAGPINRFCPIGKEPIQPNGGTITWQGREIGFCCPGCDAEFLAWSDDKKTEWVALAVAGKEPQVADEPAQPEPANEPATPAVVSINPYMLETCPISGKQLGEGAVTKTYEGREVRFCCPMCPARYESDRAAIDAKIDEQTAAAQRMGYPLDTCPISGERIVEDGKFTGVEVVHNNRLVRFCCKNCAAKFAKDPAPVLAKLDAAIVARQMANYPLKTCPVSGESLGTDGEPVNMIFANRLYRLCCPSCATGFSKTPAKYAAVLDAAYADAQRASRTVCPLSGESLDDSAVEVVAGTRLYRFCCDRCAGKFKADPDKHAARD